MSILEERLRVGRVVTAELPTKIDASVAPLRNALGILDSHVDAVSVTDNAGAHPHACALAVAAFIRESGAEPIMNLACRDRNRLALQSELLGAALHGIENVVCVTGDDVTMGDEPEARRVFDLDSPQLLSVASRLQEGRLLSGRTVEPAPRFFLGAVENPTAPPLACRVARTLKKVQAGARFFQLQIAFDSGPVEAFLRSAADIGLCERAHFLPSICIARSARQLLYLNEHVAGVSVPDDVVATAHALPVERQGAYLLDLAVSLARDALNLPWISGLHLISLAGPEPILHLLDRLGGFRLKEQYGNDSEVKV